MVELGLNLLLNMVLEFILTKLSGHLLSDHLYI